MVWSLLLHSSPTTVVWLLHSYSRTCFCAPCRACRFADETRLCKAPGLPIGMVGLSCTCTRFVHLSKCCCQGYININTRSHDPQSLCSTSSPWRASAGTAKLVVIGHGQSVEKTAAMAEGKVPAAAGRLQIMTSILMQHGRRPQKSS